MTQVAVLPADALDAYAEVPEVLQLTPWNGRPPHEKQPRGRSPALDIRFQAGRATDVACA
jgi:hypothetical protein